jgi:hypothetical protein
MDIFMEILGLLVCLGPIVGFVVFIVWVTHRPSCPSCHYGISRKDSTCPHCGCSLTPPEEP